MKTIDQIIQDLETLSSKRGFVLVAIDGNGGAGKTTLSKFLKKEIENLDYIQRDLYPSPRIGSFDPNYLKKELLEPLKQGQEVSPQIYDWPKKKFVEGAIIKPTGILILEGTLTMHKDLADLYNYRIWIECPIELGMKRALQRDNNAYKEKWENVWVPRMEKYIKEQDPASKADIVLDYKDISKAVTG